MKIYGYKEKTTRLCYHNRSTSCQEANTQENQKTAAIAMIGAPEVGLLKATKSNGDG